MAADEGRSGTIPLQLVLLILLISTTNTTLQKCDYKVGDKTFQISDWVWSAPVGNTLYKVSFCKPLKECNNAAVCKIDARAKTSLGNNSKPSTALSNDNSGFSAVFDNGASCPGKTPTKYKSEIYFFCAKTLGTLEFVEQNGCTSIFEFFTTEACKSPTKVNEIPCSILDRHNKLRDLNQLVKTKGAHQVASKTVKDFYINVCREISGEVSPGKKCPEGSSSCVESKDKGHIVQFTSLSLVNDYTINLKYANPSNGSSTNITFVCPKSILQPGGSGPILQSVSKNHYEVIWETEHACPVGDQVSTSCNITSSDGFFDLNPLKRAPGKYYIVTYANKKDGTNYKFYMNICDDMKNFPCSGNKSKTDVAVCQTWGDNNGREAGSANHKKLRYVDGRLILTYKQGATCSSGLKRSTIISFYCNESAGQGSPRFNHEDHCNYFFDWPTNIVCPRARKTSEACRVITKDNVIYDLTELTKTGRDNWQAVDGVTSPPQRIYINVCSSLNKNAITQNCPDNSAACIVDGSSHVSLGYFNSSLVADGKGSLRLNYVGGTFCDVGNRIRRKAVINFICHPGQLSTGPTLVSKTTDGCGYEFVWQTAAACPLGSKTGSDCQVSDTTAGYSFDLRPLSKARPAAEKDYFSFLDSKKEYEYQIKVCEGSKQTKCSTGGKSVGGCQYKDAIKLQHSIGEANSNLAYFDGLLKLTYFHGDKCHNGQYRETHITFLCNQTAGIGQPQFEKEVSCGTYNFLWYTKFACLAKVVECTAEDPKTKKQYDLSKLSSLHGWQAAQGNKKYYLNVCRPLYKRPQGCSSFSSACYVEVKTSQGTSVEEFKNNLGSVSQSPFVKANGDLVIEYKGGDGCGQGKTITTTIRFICKKDGAEGSPEYDAAASDSCNYIFKWETSYACPVGGSTSGIQGTCSVQDPVSKYTFDLASLTRTLKYYKVANLGKTFILNICGNVSGSECNTLDGGKQVAACISTGSKGKNYAIGQVNKQLKYSNGQISLTYSGGERQADGYEYNTIITFICNKNILAGNPTIEKLPDGHTYAFTFQTSLACSPEPAQCKLQGPDNLVYNLEPLIKRDGYWTALNRESSREKHHYFINVCEALEKRPTACPKGAIGGCQIDYNAGKQTGHSIGYIVSNPQVKNKVISFKYSNGDHCKHNNLNRSSEIFFHCSQNEGSPVFQTETNMCGYLFNWMTPAACPRTSSQGSRCRVEDSVFKHVFDLSALKTTQISVGSHNFYVNPCAPVENLCQNKAGICQKSGNSETNIGNFNDKIQLANGDLFVEFTNNDVKSKLKFVCNSQNSLSLATDAGKLSSSLKLYEFEWKTPLACLPPYNVECSLFVNDKNEDEMYDLSPLSRWDDNWRAHVDADSASSYVERKFFINVCRNVLKKQDASVCADDAGICMIREDGKSFSLGYLLKSPYKQQSEIILEYGNGDVCQGSQKYSAKIKLTSDPGEPDLGEPVLIRRQGCTYIFTWKTSAARPINKKIPVTRSDCKIADPLTGYVIDLNSLKAKDDVKVPDGRGGYFMLSVCGSLKTQSAKSKCGTNSGVCRLIDSDSGYRMNAGNANQILRYDKVISLKYTGGDNCSRCKDKCKRETIITFVCAPEEGVGKPVFMSQVEDCTHVFVWRTKHVCQKQVQCTAFGKSKTFFIGQLMQRDSNYVINAGSDTQYFINICRNLHHSSSASICPVGVAACKIQTVAGKKVATNLGEVTSSPKFNDDKSVTLTYENGDVCPTDKTKKIKTTVKFVCQRGSKGNPVFRSFSNCVYSFEWMTYTVCKDEEKVDETKCTVTDSRTSNLFDLSPLKKTHFNDYSVMQSRYTLTYFINVCGVTSVTHRNCSGAGVCRMKKDNGKTTYTNLGLIKYQVLSYDPSQSALLLKYQQDDKGE